MTKVTSHRRFYSVPPAGAFSLPGLAQLLTASRQPDMESLSEYLGHPHLLFLSSGRTALWVLLKALFEAKPDRRKVIVSAYSCPAIISAVLKAGLEPVLVDNNLEDFGFLPDHLAERIDETILAVIVVHLFGYPADITLPRRLCRQSGSFLIEDAAQGFGNHFLDDSKTPLGVAGDAAVFSFGRGKPLNLHHGGLLITQSDDVALRAAAVRRQLPHYPRSARPALFISLLASACLSHPRLYWLPQIVPFLHLGETIFEPEFPRTRGWRRMLEAADMLSRERLDGEKRIRLGNASWYRENLSALGPAGISLYDDYPYLRYPLLATHKPQRDLLLTRLRSRGTGTALFYPCPLNELPGLREVLGDDERYGNARILSDRLVTLPVHPAVPESARQGILSAFAETARDYSGSGAKGFRLRRVS